MNALGVVTINECDFDHAVEKLGDLIKLVQNRTVNDRLDWADIQHQLVEELANVKFVLEEGGF